MPISSAPPVGPSARVHVLEVVGNGIVGGMESYVQNLVERLPRDRFEVTAVCAFECRLTERLRELEVEVVVTPMPLEDPSWSSIQTVSSLVKARGVDVLHAHLANAHALAGLAGCLTGRPVLATLHGRQLTPLDMEVHRIAGTHINVVCQQSYFHALGVGVDPAHLSVIPNGVDTRQFRPAEASEPAKPGGRTEGALRRQLGLADDVPLVGFVGRLAPEKGPEVFIRAALLLHSFVPAARFVMVGDGPMREEIAASVERFGLGDCLTLLGVRSDMPAVYRSLDLLVCSSHSEAMPLAVLEAMASGLPVVATRVGGLPDIVEPDRSGWLVAPGDFQSMAERVAYTLTVADECERMGAYARRRAVERLNLDHCVERVARLLGDLVPRVGESQAPTDMRASAPSRPNRDTARGAAGNGHAAKGRVGNGSVANGHAANGTVGNGAAPKSTGGHGGAG